MSVHQKNTETWAVNTTTGIIIKPIPVMKLLEFIYVDSPVTCW